MSNLHLDVGHHCARNACAALPIQCPPWQKAPKHSEATLAGQIILQQAGGDSVSLSIACLHPNNSPTAAALTKLCRMSIIDRGKALQTLACCQCHSQDFRG